MEENNIELIDYLSVIWKRKILIIVVTLVCIVVGGVHYSYHYRSKLPETYHAEAVVKIGKKVRLMSSVSNSTDIGGLVVEYIESPELLEQTISLTFDDKVKESLGYHLSVTRVGALGMIRLKLKGPDKGVERVLIGLVDILIDEHRKKANDSVVAYKNCMKILDADAKMIQKAIARTEASIKEMKRKEGEYLVNIESSRKEILVERNGGDRSAFLNMLYLRTIDRERELNGSWKELRSIQSQLILEQITLGNLEEYKTEVLGAIKMTVTTPHKRSNIRAIIIAGVAGLIMSLFIAFFTEYIVESKSRRKGK